MHYQEKLILGYIAEKKKDIEWIRNDTRDDVEYYEETLLEYPRSIELILKYLADRSIDENEYLMLKQKHDDLFGQKFKYQKDEDQKNEKWYEIHQRLKMDYSSLNDWTDYAKNEEKRQVQYAEDEILCQKEAFLRAKKELNSVMHKITLEEDEIRKLEQRLDQWRKLPTPRRWFTCA